MYLKRLKLRNFKSFAGATEIPFQAGFTGVAGPTGWASRTSRTRSCSSWGRRSSKALRAERLTHLFFNGGSSKKAATECEVSLVFDNADKLLPVETAEVEITRYVKLAPSDPDGYYSYFYVNGKRTTQTEIDSLLSHARLSGDGYNLVQQGDINKIVTMGPIPRRGLVERLAGISQYDDELERAATKRTDLDSNLDRIQTLLTDIKSRLSGLEGQRLLAIQYKQLQDDKKRSEARLARAGHRLAEHELATCRKQVDAVRAELEELDKSRTQLSARQAELAAVIDAIDREIAEAGGAAAVKFKQEVDEKKMAYARLDQSLGHLREGLEAVATQAEELAKSVRVDETQESTLQTQESKLAERLAALAKTADDNAREIQTATGTPGKAHDKLAAARKQQLELARQTESKQNAWTQGVQSRETSSAALRNAERTQAQAEDDLREREVEVKDLELRIKEASPGKNGSGPATGDLQKELFALKTKEKNLGAERDRLAQEVLELNRRYLSLDARLKARADGGGRPTALAAVDYLLSQRNLGKIPGIRGTVEELAEFDAKLKTALQVAGGSRFQALVVETDQVAEECIKLLRDEKRGRATFLPLNKMLPGRAHGKSLVVSKAPGATGFALDLVKFDEVLRPAFWYVFGETVVMDDLGRARAQMGGVRLVTLNGDLIEATGAISGGYVDPTNQGRGSDSAVELKRLGEELRAKGAAETASRAELAKVSERIRVVAEELSTRSIQDQAHQSAREVFDKDLETAREKLSAARARIEAAHVEQKKVETALASAEATVDRLAAEIAALKAQTQKAQEQYLSQLPEALSVHLRSLQETAQKTAEERVQVNGELESVRASLAALSTSLETRRVELAKAQKDISAKKKEIAATERTLRDSRAALEAFKGVESQQSESARVQTEKKKKLDTERLDVTAKLAQAQANLETRRSMLTQEETRLAQAEVRVKELDEALKQFPEAEPDEKPISVEELKRKISALEQQLQSMGDVNLRAVEEYRPGEVPVGRFPVGGPTPHQREDRAPVARRGDREEEAREDHRCRCPGGHSLQADLRGAVRGRRRRDRAREPGRPARRRPPHQSPASRKDGRTPRAIVGRREVARESRVHLLDAALRPEPALRL